MGYSKNYIMYWGFYSYYNTMDGRISVHKVEKKFLRFSGQFYGTIFPVLRKIRKIAQTRNRLFLFFAHVFPVGYFHTQFSSFPQCGRTRCIL